jgi:hypothetical protein
MSMPATPMTVSLALLIGTTKLVIRTSLPPTLYV